MSNPLAKKSVAIFIAEQGSLPILLTKALEDRKYTVEWLNSSENIQVQLDEKNPDFIFFDYQKVDGDRATLFKDLCQDPSFSYTRFISIGDSPKEELLTRLFDAGVTDHIDCKTSNAELSQRINNIVKAYEDEMRINHMAYHDALTGLPNRLLLIDRIEHAVSRAERQNKMIALLLLDLDQFKLINDTLGHEVGDELIAEVAMRLKGQVGGIDTVARLGGDEFIVLLESIDSPADAAMKALGINEILTVPFCINGDEHHISASIGIALSPDDGKSIGRLMKHADTAMYKAKEAGRNRFCFHQMTMAENISDRLSLNNDLYQALRNDEFVVYYQPQVEAATGSITGMEALVRWQHPQRGIVSPAAFLPLAEENGLIVPISDSVLEKSCKQIHEWRESGLDVPHVAVNISTKHFYNVDLVARMKELLSRYQLQGSDITLEITETTAMNSPEEIIPVLNELKSMGVGLAIDDFGTGHSSLAYLKRFPIDVLKIDRAFVMDLATDTDDEKIVIGILSLGKVFSMKVIAEGVETLEQATILLNHDCEIIQGYLFSRPVDAGFMGELLKVGHLVPEQTNGTDNTLKFSIVK